MKALNHKERNDLFIKFLLLFVVTVAITVGAIFFDFELPTALSKSQMTKLKNYQSFYNNKKTMVKMLDSIDHTIARMGVSNMSKAALEAQASAGILSLRALDTDSASKYNISTKMADVMLNYLSTKGLFVSQTDDYTHIKSQYDELKAKYGEAKDDLKSAKQDLQNKPTN